jgi:hypothetical protein
MGYLTVTLLRKKGQKKRERSGITEDKKDRVIGN